MGNEKRPTIKELGLPKGFTLTSASRNKITETAAYKKFSPRLRELFDKYVAAYKAVIEYYTPSEELVKQFLTAKKNILYRFNGVTVETYTSSDFTIRKLKEGKYVKSYEFGATGFSHKRVYLFDNHNISIILDRLEEKKAYKHFEFTIPSIAKSMNWTVDSLDARLFKRLMKVKEGTKQLEKEIRLLRTSIDQVLVQYNSAIDLCMDVPEMVDLIRESVGMEPIPEDCSDVIEKDYIGDMRKLLYDDEKN